GFEIVSSEASSLISGSNPQISIEMLPQIESDLIFVMAWGDNNMFDPQKETQQRWDDTPLLNQMSASKDGRVFFVNYYLWGSHTRGPITDQLMLEQLPQMLLPLVNEN
ncbi:MAG: iron-siderophore ABC transporter substrate-binding protein, partial [Cyanobacteria bacterium P01_H01_bin.105]